MKDLGIGIIMSLIVVAGMAWLFPKLISTSVEATEKIQCEKLLEQSQNYEYFWITQWQKDMCDARGYTFAGTVDAPVNVDTLKTDALEGGTWYTEVGLGKWKANLETNLISPE